MQLTKLIPGLAPYTCGLYGFFLVVSDALPLPEIPA
jgi:hypothetical protein